MAAETTVVIRFIFAQRYLDDRDNRPQNACVMWYFCSIESYENIRNTNCPILTYLAKKVTLACYVCLCFSWFRNECEYVSLVGILFSLEKILRWQDSYCTQHLILIFRLPTSLTQKLKHRVWLFALIVHVWQVVLILNKEMPFSKRFLF